MFRDRRRPERRDGDRDQRGRVVVFVAVGSRAQISHRLLLRLVLLGRRVSFSHDDDSMCKVLVVFTDNYCEEKKSFFTHSKVVFFLVEKLKAKLKAIFCVCFFLRACCVRVFFLCFFWLNNTKDRPTSL